MKNTLSGWLLIDKKEGISSANALNYVKRLIPKVKIGHAGTLDPFATGLLLVAIGEATKLSEFAMNNRKEYIFTMKWGEETDTLDPEGKIVNRSDLVPNVKDIEKILPDFIGKIEQIPPAFSAIKIDGKRAYKLARQGQATPMQPRLVDCYDIKIIDNTDDTTTILVECGKGFYVRALARDIAARLNSCAYIINLARTKIGEFDIKKALKEEELSKNKIINNLYPLTDVLNIAKIDVSESEKEKLHHGMTISLQHGNLINSEKVAAIYENSLVAICIIKENYLKPIRCFMHQN